MRWMESRRRVRAARLVVEPLEGRALLSSATFAVTQDWGAGFGGQVTIANTDAAPVDNWTLEFDFDRSIDLIWDGTIASHVGNHYAITNAGWNATIAPGSTAAFGFNGSPGNVGADQPTHYALNGVPLGGPPGPPVLSIADARASEGNSGTTPLVFTVSLSSPSTSTVTVRYTTADGTATAASDYIATAGTLTFAPGVTTRTVTVSIVGDATVEPDETFTMALSGALGAGLARATATGTIVNDDTYPQPVPTSAPAVPSLDVQADAGSPGNYTATFHIWWGNNATSWQLIANGKVIYAAALIANSPNAQSATYHITGRTYSADQYQAIASNSAGSTASNTVLITVGGASTITVNPADGDRQALMVTVNAGVSTFAMADLGVSAPRFRVATNNATVIQPTVSGGNTLRINALGPGFAAVQITDDASGQTRFLGVRVRTAGGQLPGVPNYLAVGSVSEDTPSDLSFWRSFAADDTNKRIDIRYIYLNGGPVNGWRTWSAIDGGRVISYLRESEKLGIIPYFVYYNIPDGGESYDTDVRHIQSQTYMQGYFRDLKFALDLIRAEAPDLPVGMILEPDFLGYLMQNAGRPADQIVAFTDAAYAVGALSKSIDPVFPNTVQGLVKAINYLISKSAPNVSFGWQFNLWASPGITTAIPSTGLMHVTDTLGIAAGRAAIARETQAIATYYINAGVTSFGARFVSIDKYGLDAAAQVGAAANPAASTWFWNDDLWNNYLLFAKTLHDSTALPVTLWQLPVGHINGTRAVDPYNTTGVFTDLANTTQHYEDSAPDFFIGDGFTASGNRLSYFATNRGGDPKVTISGSTVTWGSHMQEAAAAGINAMLFGAGVGDSTHGTGSPPTDGYWWITKVQRYFRNPVPLVR